MPHVFFDDNETNSRAREVFLQSGKDFATLREIMNPVKSVTCPNLVISDVC